MNLSGTVEESFKSNNNYLVLFDLDSCAKVDDCSPAFYVLLPVEMIRTLPVAKKIEGFFRRQTLVLDYGFFCKSYSAQLLPYVPCVLSVFFRPLSVCTGRITFPSGVRFLG